MPKRRRKLSKELEKQILASKKKIEFVTAIINDIEEEDIQGEYRLAFEPIRLASIKLSEEYDIVGYTEETQAIYSSYLRLLEDFLNNYEI